MSGKYNIIEEAKLAEIALFEHVKEYVFSYTVFFLGVIALTIWIEILKKMFLYFIMFIKQRIVNHIKWE